MCCSAPNINIPPPPPAPEPVPPTPRELELQEQQFQLGTQNLEALRRQREDERLTREFLEGQFGVPWAEIVGGAAATQARTAKALGERYEKASRGELPVSPTLERSLTEGEGQIRERMQRALGPGWETSDPGMRALSDFKQRATELREQSARGEITRAEQMGFAQTPMVGQSVQQSPPQLNDLYQMLFGERALKNRAGELGYQGQLNYQNLMSNAEMSRAANQGSMMSGLMGMGGTVLGATAPQWGPALMKGGAALLAMI